MNQHDEWRELLPLAAAGGLDQEELARLQLHLAQCPDCNQEFERCAELALDLARLPTPAVPPWLAQRTVQRVKQNRAAGDRRRWNDRMLAFAIAFSWLVMLAGWPVAHLASGVGLLAWLEFWMVFSWLTAGSAAVIIGLHPNVRGGRL